MGCAGATIVTIPRFDLEQFLRPQDHLTRAFARRRLSSRCEASASTLDLSALGGPSGSAPLSADSHRVRRARKRCRAGYGHDRTSPVSTNAVGRSAGSVGVTVPNTEVNIVDPTRSRRSG